jgi:hypothetical protein
MESEIQWNLAHVPSTFLLEIYVHAGIFLLMRDSLFSLEVFCRERKMKGRHDRCFQILTALVSGKRRCLFCVAPEGSTGTGARRGSMFSLQWNK